MNKETLSNNINFLADEIVRTIGVDRIEYKEGDIITTNKATSWEYDSGSSFNIENTNYNYEVTFICNNVHCHKVDYDNEKEVNILNAVKGEGEVLVPAGTKFEITFVSSKEDIKEMGYCEVELEIIEE
jgi:hypothetical protein